MSNGALVKLKKYCRDSNRFAVVVNSPDNLNCVKIMFLDNGQLVSALVKNLEVISESH